MPAASPPPSDRPAAPPVPAPAGAPPRAAAAQPAPPGARPRIAPEIIAFALSLGWLVLVVAAFRFLGIGGSEGLDTLFLIALVLAVFLPLALIWVSVLFVRMARQMRDEATRLQASVEGMREDWLRERQTAAPALDATVEEKIDAIAEAQKQAETQIALFTSRRDPSRRPAPEGPDAAQPGLALDAGGPAPGPLPPAVFIRALNFPETESDEAGFAALRRALEDHGTAELVRAAQDVLSTLAEEGIFMDDLRPDRARPEVWRAFALGARGPEVAALGGVRDRSCLALTTARMRSDPEFRSAVHRFLRSFDRRFAVFEALASDGEIAHFSETRSARAFMLLGRVTGIFG